MEYTKKIIQVTLSFLLAFSANAEFPNQPIKYVIGYPPGGGTDNIGRIVSDALQQSIGQPVIVDNKPGGATTIAAMLIVQSRPDGHTIFQAENATLIYNEHLFAKLPYNPNSDFTYIASLGRMPMILVVHPDTKITNLNEFLLFVKNNSVNYASPGNGTPHHIAMELLKQRAKLEVTHIPYKGGANALQGILGRQVDVMMLDISTAVNQVKAGKLRAIGVAASKRTKLLPDVPTLNELGLNGVEAVSIHGIVGPANMPSNVVNKLNNDINKALNDPKVQKSLSDIGMDILVSSPKDYQNIIQKESTISGEVIKRANIKLD